MTVEEKIREMLEGPVREAGVRIDSINLEKEDNNLYLKIVIDRDEIIDIDKCVEVTNIINPILDREDPIKESYTLDVSTKEKGR
jgi:ribosome maturation factor RimP